MSDLEPRASYDMTGWHKLTCEQADIVMERHKGLPTFEIAVGKTDVESDSYYREWWFSGHPLLRDYRRPGECSHYGAMDDTAAVTR